MRALSGSTRAVLLVTASNTAISVVAGMELLTSSTISSGPLHEREKRANVKGLGSDCWPSIGVAECIEKMVEMDAIQQFTMDS
jgi:hypothetical protein